MSLVNGLLGRRYLDALATPVVLWVALLISMGARNNSLNKNGQLIVCLALLLGAGAGYAGVNFESLGARLRAA